MQLLIDELNAIRRDLPLPVTTQVGWFHSPWFKTFAEQKARANLPPGIRIIEPTQPEG